MKLYNYYQNEQEAKCKLEKEYHEALERLATFERTEETVKNLNKDNKTMKNRLETKSLEFKKLKSEIDDVKKDKNSLSVALKAAKAEFKDQSKDF